MVNDKRKKDAPTPTETPLKRNTPTADNISKGSKSQGKKKRNWAFIVYPESAPVDWIEQLQKTGLQCVISPLHDKDNNPTGENKKAHYHVIATYSGPTSFDVVKALTEKFNAPSPQALEQVRGYYRYLTHKDNPEKYQYDENNIKTVNGFNIADFMELSRSEVNTIKRSLQIIIRENNITEYADFMDYLLDTDKTLEYDVASNNTYFFDKYISSQRHRKGKSLKPLITGYEGRKVNNDTGEVVGNCDDDTMPLVGENNEE